MGGRLALGSGGGAGFFAEVERAGVAAPEAKRKAVPHLGHTNLDAPWIAWGENVWVQAGFGQGKVGFMAGVSMKSHLIFLSM